MVGPCLSSYGGVQPNPIAGAWQTHQLSVLWALAACWARTLIHRGGPLKIHPVKVIMPERVTWSGYGPMGFGWLRHWLWGRRSQHRQWPTLCSGETWRKLSGKISTSNHIRGERGVKVKAAAWRNKVYLLTSTSCSPCVLFWLSTHVLRVFKHWWKPVKILILSLISSKFLSPFKTFPYPVSSHSYLSEVHNTANPILQPSFPKGKVRKKKIGKKTNKC